MTFKEVDSSYFQKMRGEKCKGKKKEKKKNNSRKKENRADKNISFCALSETVCNK